MSSRPEGCGGVQPSRSLSYITAVSSAMISLSTIVTNGLLIVIFIRHRKRFLRQLFYKVIFNIILSDFLNGLIADNLTLNYVLKEGLNLSVPALQITMSHISFFVFGSVSVVTMGLLGIERQWALLQPFRYRIGMSSKLVYTILVLTWVFSILMSLMYLWLGFQSSLIIFASVTVTLSFIIMVVTVIVYYYKLIRNPFRVGMQNNTNVNKRLRDRGEPRAPDSVPNSSLQVGLATTSNSSSKRSAESAGINLRRMSPEKALAVPKSSVAVILPAGRPKLKRRNAASLYSKRVATVVEKRATKTFILILLVFIISYLPTCVIMVYMNSCKKCNCVLIHALRDATYLSMVSGAFLRPVNFIFCLKPLKVSLKAMFKCR